MYQIRTITKIFVLIIAATCSMYAAARDTIIVKKDPRLDILTAKQVQANKRTALMTTAGTYRGYRIQVLSTSSRDQAFSLKTTLDFNFAEHRTYVVYQSPNFKVRIGNFLRREDADNFRKQLLQTYPEGLYVVEDVIEYTPPEEGDEIPE